MTTTTRALQLVENFGLSARDANDALDAIKLQSGFMGGRVLAPSPGKPGYRLQAFFVDDTPADGWLPDGMRRVLVLESLKKLLGIGSQMFQPKILGTIEESGMTLTCSEILYDQGETVEDIEAGTALVVEATYTSDARVVQTGHWCAGQCGAEHDNSIYFEVLVSENKRCAHGWACSNCRRVTQSG